MKATLVLQGWWRTS
ncbi:trp operon leader peptide [Citrobacter braakii]